MVSWSNLEKLCSCSRTWMMSALACGNKWIQGGTYNMYTDVLVKSISSKLIHAYQLGLDINSVK